MSGLAVPRAALSGAALFAYGGAVTTVAGHPLSFWRPVITEQSTFLKRLGRLLFMTGFIATGACLAGTAVCLIFYGGSNGSWVLGPVSAAFFFTVGRAACYLLAAE